MTAPHDLDRQLDAFLQAGPIELPDPSFDAVRDRMESTRQRVVIGPWRVPTVNKIIPIGLGAAAVVVALIIGTQLLEFPDSGGVGAAPSPSPIGGTVKYQLDGGPATTEVTAVADGASVSGTAVTTFVGGTHTVQLECGARDGDYWIVGGTIESTTVRGERAGHGWSAVIVKEGSPQQIGIWLSVESSEGTPCENLEPASFSDIGPENFQPVKSGDLVPPPDLGA